MNKTALQISSVIGLVILIAVVSAQAQTRYRAHIPFDFTIGQKSYAAGDYFIDTVNPYSGGTTIVVGAVNGRKSHMLVVPTGEGRSTVTIGTLVFNRYETQSFLALVSTPSYIVKLRRSKAEEVLKRNQRVPQKIVALVKH